MFFAVYEINRRSWGAWDRGEVMPETYSYTRTRQMHKVCNPRPQRYEIWSVGSDFWPM